MTDVLPIDTFLSDLALWEGVVPWLYLDTKGLVTIAIGHMLPDAASTATLPLTGQGRMASAQEKCSAWSVVKRMTPGRLEASYAHATPWRLSEDDCFALARGRLETEFLPALRDCLPGFDAFPLPAQRAITDVIWNYGVGGLLRTKEFFPRLAAHDWLGASEICPRLSSRALRNGWRARMLEAAAG